MSVPTEIEAYIEWQNELDQEKYKDENKMLRKGLILALMYKEMGEIDKYYAVLRLSSLAFQLSRTVKNL